MFSHSSKKYMRKWWLGIYLSGIAPAFQVRGHEFDFRYKKKTTKKVVCKHNGTQKFLACVPRS